jgi:hypothetical protein
MSFSPETQQIIAEVERLSGRPVYVEEDPTLKVLANVTMAQGAAPAHFQALNRSTLYLSGLQSRFGVTIFGSADRGQFIEASGKLHTSRTPGPALERV